MSGPSTSTSNLQPHRYDIRSLILILRTANVQYCHIAARNRANLRPTHHARKEAQRRGLKVDIAKAVRCDQRQVSLVPLPVLDITVSPVTLRPSSIAGQSPSLEDISSQTHELRINLEDRKARLKKQSALKRATPRVFIRTTPNGTTTVISPTSDFSGSLSSPSVLKSKLVPSAYPPSMWDAGEGDTSSVSSDISLERSVSIPVCPKLHEWQPLDVPIDEDEMDWGLDGISDLSISPSSTSSFESSSDSASSSSQSSSGPSTPSDEVPITIRVKRKSIEVSGATSDFGKRPRFDRKGWVHPVVERRNVIRIPARK